MEENYLVMLCNIAFSNKTVTTHALIDCRAMETAFVDEDFTRHHQLPLTPVQYPRSLEVIDGCPISSGDISHVASTCHGSGVIGLWVLPLVPSSP
jgi:hypothetical protein